MRATDRISSIPNGVAALILAACAIVLTACSPTQPGVTEVEIWAMGREGEILPELLNEFEAKHPAIRVKVQKIPWTAAHEKLLTAFVGGALPDVAQLGNTWIAEFAALDALTDLTAPLNASTAIDRRDYFPGVWATNVVDGSVFGVPWYVDTRLLFYRTDLLAKAGFDHPPRDWAELRQACEAVKKAAGPGNYAFLLPLNEFGPQLMLALQQDDPTLRENGQFGNFSSSGQRAALDFYLSFFRDGLAPPATDSEIANVWNEFARGYFSFYITGPWNIGNFRERLPQDLQDAWMTAPLPGPDGPGASIAGGSSLVVFKTSKHTKAALQLVEFLAKPEIQARFYALSGNLPPRRSSWDFPETRSDPHIAAFRDQLERTVPAPQVPEWERIAQELRIVTEKAVHENWDAETAARELDSRIDAILEKRRWMLARKRDA
ncbi:MAG: sugar ABC transporter substrate-binding protein [Pseudomonadota bacterium]